MNREEAIKLANDMAFMASIWVDDQGNEVNDLVKFAQLVADYVRSPEWLARRTEAAIAAEREIIADQFWGCVMSDLEHGVKSLNEKAAFDFQKNMPDLSKFGRWLNERGQA